MKGLELSRKFYEQYGAPMLKSEFAEIEKYLAVGLIGSGSECLGYDDLTSQDHDFEAGFCIFLPDEVDERTEFLLERAYSRLPEEFMGYKKAKLNPVGGNRHGVIRISSFLKSKLGTENGQLSLNDFFFIEEQFLLEVTNGEIFCDNLGLLTEVRRRLSYLPEDVRLKKLAGNLLLMAQSGQYNYPRCIKRGDTAAAQLSVGEFVNAALKTVYLINRKYMPYYKWAFRGLREMPILSGLYESLEYLISSPNLEPQKKQEIIESVCKSVADELLAQGLTKLLTAELEPIAYNVNDRIKDPEIRNLSVLYGV